MTRPRLRIGSELLPVCLILASLVGTSFLIVSMHRRAASLRKKPPIPAAPPLAITANIPTPVLLPPAPPPPESEAEPEPEPEPTSAPAPVPAAPVEDPTRTALARLGAEEAEQLLAIQAADRKAKSLELSTQTALAESHRWKRREQLIRGQINTLNGRVRSLEQEADALAMERDVLAQELDASKAALIKAQTRSSYAVVPNRAPNGTWRRPIVIECHNGSATLQPGGPTFSLLDLSALLGTRSSPILLAVVRELTRIQGVSGPDGAPIVPYIFFVVRPDGIRPFYDARARLESLGIAFGYELVDQDMEIDYPDLDHPDEWDGVPKPSKLPEIAMGGDSRSPSPPGRATGAARSGHNVDEYRWPTGAFGASEGTGVPSDEKGRRTSGSNDPTGPRSGISLGDLGMPGDRGTSSSATARNRERERERELADLGRSGDLGREISRARGLSTGSSSSTPGMLPPLGGSMDRPGMVPATGGGSGDHSGGGGSPASGSFARTGQSGPNHKTPQAEIPFGVNVPSRPGALAQGERAGTPPPFPEDVSKLDGVSLMGRQPGEGAPFRPRGLLPGEPGAPPEESANASGIAGQSGAGQRSSGGPPGSQGSGTASGTGGEASATGSGTATASAAGAGASSSSGGVAGGQAGGAGEPSPGSRAPLRIEVPMEIVVACSPSGVVIHPGGYRISLKALKGKDPIFTTSLKTIVRLRQQVDPMIRPKPSIRFLVEPGGGETYRDARRVTVLSGIEWPTVLQVADTRVLDFLPQERF